LHKARNAQKFMQRENMIIAKKLHFDTDRFAKGKVDFFREGARCLKDSRKDKTQTDHLKLKNLIEVKSTLKKSTDQKKASTLASDENSQSRIGDYREALIETH